MTLDITNAHRITSGGQDGSTTIDLSEVRFLLPGGIVSVACTARSAQEMGVDVQTVPPTSEDVGKYASRMGLNEVLATCGTEINLPEVQHHERGDVLVECAWADSESIGGLAEMIGERLWDAGVDARAADLLTMAVYEVADNVTTHSAAGGGFVCAQTYHRGTPGERVEVAIGDVGRGIRASLSAMHTISDDETALRLAITESVSGLNPRRGLGLHYVARDIPSSGGRLTLRSGSAYLQVHPGGPFSSSCPQVVGTLVGIRVPVGRMKDGRP